MPNPKHPFLSKVQRFEPYCHRKNRVSLNTLNSLQHQLITESLQCTSSSIFQQNSLSMFILSWPNSARPFPNSEQNCPILIPIPQHTPNKKIHGRKYTEEKILHTNLSLQKRWAQFQRVCIVKISMCHSGISQFLVDGLNTARVCARRRAETYLVLHPIHHWLLNIVHILKVALRWGPWDGRRVGLLRDEVG